MVREKDEWIKDGLDWFQSYISLVKEGEREVEEMIYSFFSTVITFILCGMRSEFKQQISKRQIRLSKKVFKHKMMEALAEDFSEILGI